MPGEGGDHGSRPPLSLVGNVGVGRDGRGGPNGDFSGRCRGTGVDPKRKPHIFSAMPRAERTAYYRKGCRGRRRIQLPSRLCAIALLAASIMVSGSSVALGQPVGAAAQPFERLRPNVPGPLFVPCDGLPSTAVRVVPSPLDKYVTIVCTRSGQALKPLDGYKWFFDQGPMMLSATNPNAPSKDDHYTALDFEPLGPGELASLRVELAKLKPNPEVLTRSILRFAVSTSYGEKKEIYLLTPSDGVAHVLGMECVHSCRPIESDPWFFTIVPTK
jgi:hypothetical protein